ncbi:MAG: hypothetical protein BGP16_05520 [Sphingobium sp. 66-54]|nr:MAG: hypothetical protein BGP16_05520 [Sphingobium sp. 66-54]
MASYTEADLQRIRGAIARGIKSVTFADGRKREYHSLTEMLAAEKVIAAAVEIQTEAVGGRGRRRTPYYKSGL